MYNFTILYQDWWVKIYIHPRFFLYSINTLFCCNQTNLWDNNSRVLNRHLFKVRIDPEERGIEDSPDYTQKSPEAQLRPHIHADVRKYVDHSAWCLWCYGSDPILYIVVESRYVRMEKVKWRLHCLLMFFHICFGFVYVMMQIFACDLSNSVKSKRWSPERCQKLSFQKVTVKSSWQWTHQRI